MQLSFAVIIASAAALVSAAPHAPRGCAQAAQFGTLSISPTSVSAGDNLTISANFDCAINWFSNIPEYTDYYIEVPTDNNGHEPPILLARRTLPAGNITDEFTVTVPDAYYFANASYSVTLDTTYSLNGTNGIPYSAVGGVYAPIAITPSS